MDIRSSGCSWLSDSTGCTIVTADEEELALAEEVEEFDDVDDERVFLAIKGERFAFDTAGCCSCCGCGGGASAAVDVDVVTGTSRRQSTCLRRFPGDAVGGGASASPLLLLGVWGEVASLVATRRSWQRLTARR